MDEQTHRLTKKDQKMVNGGKQNQETQAITRHAYRTNKLGTLVQEMCYIWQPVLSLK